MLNKIFKSKFFALSIASLKVKIFSIFGKVNLFDCSVASFAIFLKLSKFNQNFTVFLQKLALFLLFQFQLIIELILT